MTAYLDRTTNLFGTLGPEVRRRLERVLADPTSETWDEAHSIIVDARRMTTLWQAWIAVDDTAPRIGPANGKWPRAPDQLTLYRAIRHATA